MVPSLNAWMAESSWCGYCFVATNVANQTVLKYPRILSNEFHSVEKNALKK